MIEEKYFISPGLQVVKIDESRLSINLYGRRFTLSDETGLVEAIFVSATSQGLTRSQLLEDHANAWPSEVVETVLKSLASSNFLQASDKRTPALATMDFLKHSSNVVDKIVSSFGTNIDAKDWSLKLAGEGELAGRLGGALRELGFDLRIFDANEVIPSESKKTTLIIACSDSTDHAWFRALNQKAVTADLATLFVSVDAHMAKCGPMAIPRANACYECYFHRISSTRSHITEFNAASLSSNVVCQPTPNMLALYWAVSAALTKVLAVTSGLDMDSHLAPLQEINVFQGDITTSRLLKIPRCPVCGVANGNRPFHSVINTKLALKAGNNANAV